MFVLLPLILIIILYFFKENKITLLHGNISTIIILSKSLIINEYIILIIFIILICSLWIYFNIDINDIISSIITISTILATISASIISLFISLEMLSISIIILINLYLKDKYPGIIYFIISSLFTSLFILSIGYINIGYIIFFKFIYIVLTFKIGYIPFHILLPNLYNDLSPINLLLIDISYKMTLLSIFYRLYLMCYDSNNLLVLNLILSILIVIFNKNLFSIMIYSSIFNYSLILITIIFRELDYFIYYSFIYFLNTILFILFIVNKYIYSYICNNFWYLLFWLLILINLMGIPPFNGFWIKYYIINILIFNYNYLWLILVLIGILLLSYTYIRIYINLIINNRENTNIIKSRNYFYCVILCIILLLCIIPILFI